MKASIDIGTSTDLLLVAGEKNGRLKVVYEEQRVPRLGAGVDESKNLSGNAINRGMKHLIITSRLLNQQFPSVNSIKVSSKSLCSSISSKN